MNGLAGVGGATASFMQPGNLETGPFIDVMTSDKLYDLFTQRGGVS